MSVEEFKQQFQRIIARRGFGEDKYIDSAEEREVVNDCLEAGIPLDGAQAVLSEVCQEKRYILESAIKTKIARSLAASLGDDGKIDQGEFDEAVQVALAESRGLRDEVQCKRLVIEMIERGEAPVKTGFLSNWFKQAKKEVGLA